MPTVYVTLDSINSVNGHKERSMDSHEIWFKFVLQQLEGFIDQIFSSSVIHRDILLVGTKKTDTFHRNQAQLIADTDGDIVPAQQALTCDGDLANFRGCQTLGVL